MCNEEQDARSQDQLDSTGQTIHRLFTRLPLLGQRFTRNCLQRIVSFRTRRVHSYPVGHVNVLVHFSWPVMVPRVGSNDVLVPLPQKHTPPTKRTIAHYVVLELAHHPKRPHLIRVVDKRGLLKMRLLTAPCNIIGKHDKIDITPKRVSKPLHGSDMIAISDVIQTSFGRNVIGAPHVNDDCAASRQSHEQIVIMGLVCGDKLLGKRKERSNGIVIIFKVLVRLKITSQISCLQRNRFISYNITLMRVSSRHLVIGQPLRFLLQASKLVIPAVPICGAKVARRRRTYLKRLPDSLGKHKRARNLKQLVSQSTTQLAKDIRERILRGRRDARLIVRSTPPTCQRRLLASKNTRDQQCTEN
jgi:hypothetical protein